MNTVSSSIRSASPTRAEGHFSTDLATVIGHDANFCVACGLCLPVCPSYQKTRNEADSPRGRISLAQALASGQLGYSRQLQQHLDRCLGCRACEFMCPSKVRFHRLLTHSRALISESHRQFSLTKPIQRFFRNHILTNRTVFERFGRLLRIYQKSGLQTLLRYTGLLKIIGLARLERNLPPITTIKSFASRNYATPAKNLGKVSLFSGCVNSTIDNNVLAASIRVLTHIGFDVDIPEQQGCCGAVHLHAGDRHRAAKLADDNLKAFSGNHSVAIISTASGCTSMLKQYADTIDTSAAAGFSQQITDINRFLLESGSLSRLNLRPLAKRIALHVPCSQRNTIGDQRAVFEILAKIPGCEILRLPETMFCCGGAGTYVFRQPQLADELRADVLAEFERLTPDIVVTTNVGCSLFLRSGIDNAGLDLELKHPVELLESLLL